MSNGSKDQKLWALCSPIRTSWRIPEAKASIYPLFLLEPSNPVVCLHPKERDGWEGEQWGGRSSFPSCLGQKVLRVQLSTWPTHSQLTTFQIYSIFLRVSANNRKLKMTAYKLQNALDSYILIISPLSRRKENNRKGGKEAERDNGEGERGHYLQKPSLEPWVTNIFFHCSEEA